MPEEYIVTKRFYGYWTCRYCGHENRGNEYHCKNCGAPRDEETVFYPHPKQTEKLNEAENEDPASQGPDWHCSYCNSLNPANSTNCWNCAAPRTKDNKTYFELHPERTNTILEEKDFALDDMSHGKQEDNSEPEPEQAKDNQTTANLTGYSSTKSSSPKLRLATIIILGVIALIVFFAKLFTPTLTEATILDKSWQRQVIVEQYRTFHENDWYIPSGGRLTSSRQEIHHYEQVVDHYETVTKTRQVPSGGHYEVTGQRQVPNGGHYEPAGYVDNGDGTFNQVSRWVTDYTTENIETWVQDYTTEYYTENEPVYRSEPIFRTKYYYDIERWAFDHYEVTSGHLEEPYFAEPELASGYRTHGTKEFYSVSVTCTNRKGENITNDYELNFAQWSTLEVGQIVPAKLYVGNHVELVFPEE